MPDPYSYTTPANLRQALSSPDANAWRMAIADEMEAHATHGTWILVPRPPGVRVIKSGFVFKLKPPENGSTLPKYKARLVAKGYSQVEGVDVGDTFSPVARGDTIRVALAVATIHDYHVHHWDVATAFLNGYLDEEVYMEPPPGTASPDQVCLLVRSLYGLKQAPRCWHDAAGSALTDCGLAKSSADSCLWILRIGNKILFILLYVDDMLVFTNCIDLLATVKARLFAIFSMKDLGAVRTFLGVEILRDRARRIMHLSQGTYTASTLLALGMDKCKPASTPEPSSSTSDTPATASPLKGAIKFRTLVGMLNHLSNWTRPDIRSAVREISSRQAAPHDEDWGRGARILRYLQGTQDYGLTYTSSLSAPTLKGYCDASYASDPTSRRSVTGYVFFVGDCAVTWFAGLQKSVSLSTAESEYVAVSDGCKEAVWLSRLLSDLGAPQKGPIPLLEDNQACIALASNPRDHTRTKHIDVRHHHIRERVQAGEVTLVYVPTASQVADIFTKGLSLPLFSSHRRSLGILSSGGVLGSTPHGRVDQTYSNPHVG